MLSAAALGRPLVSAPKDAGVSIFEDLDDAAWAPVETPKLALGGNLFPDEEVRLLFFFSLIDFLKLLLVFSLT